MTNDFPFTGFTDARPGLASAGADRIRYVTIGRGSDTFVFVHGWAGNLGFWREQIPRLANEATLLLIDLPGHGGSDKPQAAYTLDFFADGVLAVLRDAQVAKAVFVGHSMGAAVLCRLHHRAPEKFAALVSVDGLLRRPPGTAAETRALVGPFGSPQYLAHAGGFISTLFSVPVAEALRERVTSEMLATPQHVMLGSMLGMFGPDQPDWVLKKVDAPVLVINAPSPWWSDGYETYVRSLSPRSEYVVMEGVGHFPMLERPAEFNALLLSLLQKHHLIGD